MFDIQKKLVVLLISIIISNILISCSLGSKISEQVEESDNIRVNELNELKKMKEEEVDDINDEKGELFDIEFEIKGQSSYDPTSLYKYWSFKPGSNITLWDELQKSISLDTYSKKYKFIAPDIDFKKYNLILAYGRQIISMECQNDPRFGIDNYVLTVTFAEKHEGNKVFFYQVDKRIYVPCDLASPGYIMQGDERIYIPNICFSNEYDGKYEPELKPSDSTVRVIP